ncbi:MAG: hypothetical protein ACTSYA_11325 [Candidatus Kariarchaeaceae archaeon]
MSNKQNMDKLWIGIFKFTAGLLLFLSIVIVRSFWWDLKDAFESLSSGIDDDAFLFTMVFLIPIMIAFSIYFLASGGVTLLKEARDTN